MKASGIGILGMGHYLPPKIRKNSDWPKEFLESFNARPHEDIGKTNKSAKDLEKLPPNARIAMEEMSRYRADPFHGAIERRVVEPGTPPSDSEILAGKEALKNTGLKPEDIDFCLVQSAVPDMIVPNNSAIVHEKLGLRMSAPSIGVDGSCGSFLYHFEVASALITANVANRVLIVQSAIQSPIVDYTSPLSTTFGDAATAAVIGRVENDRGLLSAKSYMNGKLRGAAVVAPRCEDPWYRGNGGPFVYRSLSEHLAADLIGSVGDVAQSAVNDALAEAQISAKDVSFFACHQTVAAFGEICRKAAGLSHTRTMDTFPVLGAISACSVPMNLIYGQKEGLLKKDDIAVLFTTGAGLNWSAAVIRW